MKPTTKQPRKALAKPVRLGLLAAVSGFAIGAAATGLSAQSAPQISASTAPVTQDVYGSGAAYASGLQPIGGPAAQGGLQPIGVGPAVGYGGAVGAPIGVGSVAGSPATTLGAPVRRGRWTTSVTPYVEGTVTYSDNINLDPDGFEESETILTTTGGVVFGAQNERVVGTLGLQASYDVFLNDTNDDGVRLNANTAWSAAVVPNLFYVDIAGDVTEFYDTNDADFSGNSLANSDERSRVYSGLISPSLRRNIGGWANAELRYTGRAQVFDDDDLDGGYSHTVSAGITGDPRKFRRFGWQAVTEYEIFQNEDDDGGEDINRWTSYVSLDVPVTRTVALTATAGYDHFSEDVTDDDLSGAFGNVGARWQPTTRFAARAFGGYRYDGLDYGAEATYALRQNLVAGLSARRGVQFTNFANDGLQPISLGTDAAGRPSFLDVNGDSTPRRADAATVDPLTGNLVRAADIDVGDQDDDAIVDNVQAFVSGKTGRTTWNANVQAAHYDYGSSFGTDETIIAASANVGRALTNRVGLSLGAGLTSVSVDDTSRLSADSIGDYETLSLGVGLDYQLTEIVNVFGRYTYTTRFADDAQNEFDENAGVVGVRASF